MDIRFHLSEVCFEVIMLWAILFNNLQLIGNKNINSSINKIINKQILCIIIERRNCLNVSLKFRQ